VSPTFASSRVCLPLSPVRFVDVVLGEVGPAVPKRTVLAAGGMGWGDAAAVPACSNTCSSWVSTIRLNW
jgi:hypothetical protein